MNFDARPDRGIHVATIAHTGRIWDAFLEFDGDPQRPDIYRARLRFEPTNPSDGEQPARTAAKKQRPRIRFRISSFRRRRADLS